MNYLLDTNIALLRIKSIDFRHFFDSKYPSNEDDIFAISVVSLGELESLSIQNNWSALKIQALERFTNTLLKIDINNQPVINAYGQIDAYSQGRLLNNPLPNGLSSRNMGKNDLWISACAYAINATLITTDKDFNHLESKFLTIDLIDIKNLGIIR